MRLYFIDEHAKSIKPWSKSAGFLRNLITRDPKDLCIHVDWDPYKLLLTILIMNQIVGKEYLGV